MSVILLGPRAIAASKKRTTVIWGAVMGVCFAAPLVVQAGFDVVLPWWAWPLLGIGARLCYLEMRDNWHLCNRYERGADAEDEVATLLYRLPQGWQVEKNLAAPGLGDIDLFVQAPDGRAFAIDVKSHAGTIVEHDGVLRRRMGRRELDFEKDFLSLILRQAIQMKERRGLRFVTPVLAFARAQVDLAEPLVRNVHIVSAKDLREFLVSHDARPEIIPSGERASAATVSQRRHARGTEGTDASTCDACSEPGGDATCCRDEMLSLAQRTGVGPMGQPYSAALYNCWQCHEKMLVFTWPGHEMWSAEHPPEPKPKSVRWVWSKSVQAYYWANTCLLCDAVQGDHFVYDEARDTHWHAVPQASPRDSTSRTRVVKPRSTPARS